MTEVLINGRVDDRVPADDRGLLYGDCLFETIGFRAGVAPLWSWHWQRLTESSARLGLVVPDEDIALDECRQLAGNARCVIRLTLTRGSGGRAYEPPAEPDCRRIVHRRDWPARIGQQRDRGVRVVTSPIHLAGHSLLAGMKHGNRLEQVLAAKDCRERSVEEALMLDVSGNLVEAIASNVIVVIEGRALTPRVEGAGVAGVGLAWLRSQPEVALESATINRHDMNRAEEVMMINSVAGIRPVMAVDDRALDVGKICRTWQRLWTERID